MNNKLIFTKVQKISLKEHPDFDETWLRKTIEDDPTIIGLGDIELKASERIQPKAGRLDLLFYDRENEKRYEVEIMLGKIDESHIIRSIEYWDIERKHYPNYEHCAVVIAEDITTRFLNIINLFNGQIPIIAIQLNALVVEGDKLILDFVTVLNENSGSGDEEDEIVVKKDRTYWENKTNRENSLKLVDDCYNLIKGIDSELSLSYNQYYIGLAKRNRSFNFIVFRPKQKFVRVYVFVSDKEVWAKKLEENDCEVMPNRQRGVEFRITKDDIVKNRDLFIALFKKSYQERSS